ARNLSLLQHGPGGCPEPRLVRAYRPDVPSPTASSNLVPSRTRSRSAGAGALGALRTLTLPSRGRLASRGTTPPPARAPAAPTSRQRYLRARAVSPAGRLLQSAPPR